jgi:hypothetical protein
LIRFQSAATYRSRFVGFVFTGRGATKQVSPQTEKASRPFGGAQCRLMRSGVSRRQAIRHGKSRKGYWHMAETIASGVGMTNKWLQEQGLVSLKSLWALLTPPVDRHNAG